MSFGDKVVFENWREGVDGGNGLLRNDDDATDVVIVVVDDVDGPRVKKVLSNP